MKKEDGGGGRWEKGERERRGKEKNGKKRRKTIEVGEEVRQVREQKRTGRERTSARVLHVR